MAEESTERLIFEFELDTKDAEKRSVQLEKNLTQIREALKQNRKSFKEGSKTIDEYSKDQVTLQKDLKATQSEQRQVNKEIQLSNKVLESNVNSYQELSAQLAIEEKRLKELSSTLKIAEDGTLELNEAFDEQFDKVKKLREGQLAFDKAIRNGRTNVGNYEASFTEALEKVNLFGAGLGNITEILKNPFQSALMGANQALKFLSANPIIAILGTLAVLLNQAFKAFSKTEEGANDLAASMGLLNAILEPIKFVLEQIGNVVGILIKGFEALSSVIDSVFGTNLSDGAKLERQLQAINKQIELQEALTAQVNLQIEKEKTLRDDELKTFEARLSANEKAGKLIQKRLNTEVKLEEDKLKIFRRQLENATSQGTKAELNKQISEQQRIIAEKRQEIEGQIVEQITNEVQLLRDQAAAQIEILDLQTQRQLIEGKIQEGSREELNIQLKRNELVAKTELKAIARKNKLTIDTENKTAEEVFKIIEKQEQKRINETRKTLLEQKRLFEKQQEQLENIGIDFKGISQKDIDDELEKLKTSEFELQKTRETLRLSDAEARKKFNETQLSNFQKFQEQIAQAEEKRLASIRAEREANNKNTLAGLELEVLKTQENTEARLFAELDLIRQRREILLQNEKLTENERLKIIEESNKEARELTQSYTNFLENENQKRLDDETQISNLITQKRVQDLEFILEQEQKTNAEILEDDNKTTQEKLNSLDMFAQKSIEILQKQAELEIQTELQKQQQILENTKLNDLEKEIQLLESSNRIQEIERTSEQSLTDIQRQQSETRKEISDAETENELQNLQAVAGALDQASQLFEQDTIAFKFLATTQAITNTFLAATQTLADPQLPTLAKLILVPTVIATGLANVAQIQSAADGAIIEAYDRGGRVRGAGTSKSDSIPAMLSNGEVVINSESSRNFLPVLDYINRAGGGKPLIAQEGGVANIGSAPINNQVAQSFGVFETTLRAIQNVQIVTKITDLQEVQTSVDNTVSFSEF